jgi:Mg-chelatase subunit ChlD
MNKDDLAKRDYVVMIDKSGSMTKTDCPNGKTRWEHAQEQTENVARACAKFDDDGIDVVVFNDTPTQKTGVTPDAVEAVFAENNPNGGTDTAKAMKMVLDGYFSRKASGIVKPLTVICVTDGEPNDENALVKTIVDASNKLDSEDEIGICFMQVGKDEHARAFLQRLDDNLTKEGAKFDIVDTKNDEEMSNIAMEDLLLAAVND